MKQKRSQLDVIHDMLAAMQRKQGKIRPTHLLSKSNLSHKMMREYVAILKQRGLIEEDEEADRRVYLLTTKGHQFLAEYQRLAQFTEAFGL